MEIVDFPMKNGWIFPVRYGNSGFSHEKWVDLSSSLWKIVDFPMKNGWIFPVRYGNSGFSHEKWVDLSSSLWK